MLRLKNRNIVPPLPFSYQPEGRAEPFTAVNWPALMKKALDYHKANQLPVGLNFEANIEAAFCKLLIGSGYGEHVEDAGSPYVEMNQSFRLKLNQVIQGTMFLVSHLLHGSPKVAAEEAEARAQVCVNCPLNQEPEGCWGCGSRVIQSTIRSLIGNTHTSKDALLKSCRVCGCFNAVQIHFPLAELQKTVSTELNELLPAHCWKKRA